MTPWQLANDNERPSMPMVHYRSSWASMAPLKGGHFANQCGGAPRQLAEWVEGVSECWRAGATYTT